VKTGKPFLKSYGQASTVLFECPTVLCATQYITNATGDAAECWLETDRCISDIGGCVLLLEHWSNYTAVQSNIGTSEWSDISLKPRINRSLMLTIQLSDFSITRDDWAYTLSLCTVCGDACPFHVSVLRPASQDGPMHDATGMGKLVNAALLSLINGHIWTYAVLPSSWVNSSAPFVCRHDQVTREAGRVALVGRERGGGDTKWHCTWIFILSSS